MEFPQRLGVEVIEMPVRYVDVIGIENFGAEDRRRSVPPRRPVRRLVEPGIDDQPLACSADLEAGMTNDTELHTRLFLRELPQLQLEKRSSYFSRSAIAPVV